MSYSFNNLKKRAKNLVSGYGDIPFSASQSPGAFVQGVAEGVAPTLGPLGNTSGTFMQGFASSTFAPGVGFFGQNIHGIGSPGTKGVLAQGYAADSGILSYGTAQLVQGATIGSGSIGLVAFGTGTIVQGFVTGASAGVIAIGNGNFVQGFAYSEGPGDGAIIAAGLDPNHRGIFAQGYARGDEAELQPRGQGVSAQGAVFGSGKLKPEGLGNFVQGFSSGTSVRGGDLNPNGNGIFVQGYSSISSTTLGTTISGAFVQGAFKSGSVSIGDSSRGTFAQGIVRSEGSIISTGNGTFVQGLSEGASAYLSTLNMFNQSSAGSFVQGAAYAGSQIRTGDSGSFAQGAASGGSAIYSKGAGAFSQGWSGVSSQISAEKGGFARGYASEQGQILTDDNGGSASGFAMGAGTFIRARGSGSFAFGFASGSSVLIEASASHSAQFFPSTGSNNKPFSLRVGHGPRLRDLEQLGTQPSAFGSEMEYGDIGHSGSALITKAVPFINLGGVAQSSLLTSSESLTASFDQSIYLLNSTNARAIELPTDLGTELSPTRIGIIFTIKDASFSAATGPITVTVGGGGTIDGESSQVININSASLTVVGNGADSYFII